MSVSIKNIIRWAIQNILIWIVAITMILGFGGLYYTFSFIVWILFLSSIVIWLAMVRSVPGDNYFANMDCSFIEAVPLSVDMVLDSCLVALIVGFGYWFLGILLMIHILAYVNIRKLIQAKAL